MDTCTILTWNIRQGGKKHRENIITSIMNHQADINVLTEYHENATGKVIKNQLADGGWQYAALSQPKGNENGILVTGKYPLQSLPVKMAVRDGRVRELLVYCPTFDITILCSHIPNINEKYDKTTHWEFVCQYAEKMKKARCIMIGDFNTARRTEKPKSSKKYSHYIDLLEENGWCDAWKQLNPHLLDYTWYSHKQNGYRLDYVFLSPMLKENLLVCYHSHRERLEKYSDHSPVIAKITT